ncbi:hypothetical protein [Clostridium fungisolvens]|uniref:Uncharacterized protein n=1 Tax=Clostridium fungisolvens TaxID=1604897 RepID=A0A6V8SMT0_9CLOT|nr:hypothetical protein [Clostridium fungisolvens]GFP78477.1 hypothetical protein bsdtw1_04702 [Clostridium fungisolvens]
MKKIYEFLGLDNIEKYSKSDTKDLVKLSIIFLISSLYSSFYTYDYYKSYLSHPSDLTLMGNAKGAFVTSLGLGYTFLYFFINIFLSRRKTIKTKLNK